VVGGIPGGTGRDAIPLALAGRPPVVLSRVTPTYPAVARERRIEGVVVLRGVVDVNGRPTRLQVVQSTPLLDDAALAAFEQWRFTPGRDREGNVVPVLIEVPMRFKLQ
jgi:protein TonB